MEFTGTKINSFKNEMLKAIQDPKFPAEIRQAVMEGSLKIVDAAIYSAKVLDKTAKELMVASDNKKEGLTNINNRKLEATNYFLLGAIRLQSATISGTTDTDVAAANFGVVAPEIANGELEVLVAGKTYFPRNSCQLFKSAANDQTGLYRLDCPRLVCPQSEIVPTLRINALPASDTAVRVDFIGAMLIPA